MSTNPKNMTCQRLKAFLIDEQSQHYEDLKNAVNRKRKNCKSKFYRSKVEDLKSKD